MAPSDTERLARLDRPPCALGGRRCSLLPSFAKRAVVQAWSARKRVEVMRRCSVQRCGAALHNPFGVQVCVTVVAGWDPS